MSKAYLTVLQVADRLAVRPAQVIRLIRAGLLPATNVGLGTRKPRLRISEAALGDFLVARQVQPAPRLERRRRQRPAKVIPFF